MDPIILAQISGSGMVRELGVMLIVIICVLILWWMGRYLLPLLDASAMVMKIWDGLFVLIGGFVLINLLMGLAGHPLIAW
jgi:hypothetical protein